MTWNGVYYLTDDRLGGKQKARPIRHVMVYATIEDGEMRLGSGVFKVESGLKCAVWGPMFKKRMVATAKGRALKCPLVLEGSFRYEGKALVRTMADGTARTFAGHEAVRADLIRPAVLVHTSAKVPSLAVRGARFKAA